MSHVIALLGARGTGKTTLARELTRILSSRGMDVALVPDALPWPSAAEAGAWPSSLLSVAAWRKVVDLQAEKVASARASHEVTLIDTPAFMAAAFSAVYGEFSPDAASLREQADALGVAVGDSPYRAQFGMLHGVSSVFYLVQSLLGLALIWKAAGIR